MTHIYQACFRFFPLSAVLCSIVSGLTTFFSSRMHWSSGPVCVCKPQSGTCHMSHIFIRQVSDFSSPAAVSSIVCSRSHWSSGPVCVCKPQSGRLGRHQAASSRRQTAERRKPGKPQSHNGCISLTFPHYCVFSNVPPNCLLAGCVVGKVGTT